MMFEGFHGGPDKISKGFPWWSEGFGGVRYTPNIPGVEFCEGKSNISLRGLARSSVAS